MSASIMPPIASKSLKKGAGHKCDHCSYVTHRRSFMLDHIRVHTGEKPFKCDTCGKSFSQKSNLRQHLKVHNEGNGQMFSCDICEFKTKWKSSLLVHERMHNGEKPYKCKICDRAFSQSTHCQTHMREAHLNMRKYQCETCQKTFKRSEHLDRHMAFHKMQRDHECDICHKKYLDARYLKQHKLIHEGESSKIHKCPNCPYKSRYKQGLRIHGRTHCEIKPFQCEDCGKSFVTSRSLSMHIRLAHQAGGENPNKVFCCDQCTFTSGTHQNLKMHIIKVHLKGASHFRCRYCSRVCPTYDELSLHMTETHPKQMCEEQRLRQQGKAAVKVIGSISRSQNSDGTISAKSKLSLKLKRKACGFRADKIIKTEKPDEAPQPEESLNEPLSRTMQVMLGGKPIKMNEIQDLDLDDECNDNYVGKTEDNEVASSDKNMTQIKNKMQCNNNENAFEDDIIRRSNNGSDELIIDEDFVDRSATDQQSGNPSSLKSKIKPLGGNFLRIKLNTPKVVKKKNKQPPRKNNKVGSVQNSNFISINLSSACEKKTPKSPVVTSARAKKLFMNPEVYIDRDSELESNSSYSSLKPRNGVIEIRPIAAESETTSDHDDDDVTIVDYKQSRKATKASQQYDSLRAIVSDFQSVGDIKKEPPFDIPEESTSHLIRETIEGENGEMIDVQMMKNEPDEDFSTHIVNQPSQLSTDPEPEPGLELNGTCIKTESEDN